VALTTVLTIERVILLIHIISCSSNGLFMNMLCKDIVLIIGLMELVRVSEYCKRLQ